ncbi:uroporphyrinogen-III synthase [Methylobacterium sp. J-076]|uniref:uroporphyrinogen-III synthase n=1 Tax=Methylobacterium sp. J-076 TaxID=2836655 RepID=UPI001FBA5888|nr:uroporphyrinogen-III synthase [Methylobacterium sp. J-076]MCJ2014321.1 uroporphyrinogen-III synthase [Methylobacterium sp. J-076]
MRVWVARPEPGASRTGAALAGLGHAALVAPVLAVRPVGEPPPAGPFEGIVLTSANAVPALGADFRGVPVFAVGARTAERAAAAGLGPVTEGPGDGAGLAALVRGRLKPGARLLHAAGAERKPEPAAALEAAGFRLVTHVAYRAEPVPRLPDPVGAALAAEGLEAALHYSHRSAEAAASLCEAAGLGGAFRALDHYCLSADVARALEVAGVPVHFVAAYPRESALLDGLSR